jgi:glycosyltransferase involved in cell wall biosynthesis
METLDAADVLVHPSYADAFPTTLLEAMAARVPIVATDVGGIPEIVEDGTTGILLDATATANRVATALATALQDAALRARLADEAQRRYAANFTALTWARRLRRLYDAELGG